MAVDLALAPKRKRPAGEPCCEPLVHPDVSSAKADRIAALGKVLSDPVRVQLVDVLGKAPAQVCVCELQPLFDISQPTLSHHLKKLREAGIVGVERRGLWAYYHVLPNAMKELSEWLS
jgi:ArsR family transcriptional regulator, arsenate/arsenite/antimonite-responsive transcriptional repressor